MNNYMPQVQALQQKMTDARRRGDMYDSQRYGMELQTFMKEKQINPLKNMLPIMVQMPIFMSMFIGLRGMANLPVESLSRGGLLWFDDLTLADPFYVLPLITSASLYLQIKLGADGANLNQVGALGKIAMKAMPLILFPLTMSFPSASVPLL
jgi:YidC/Oxa1 family membrane protein insertase